MIIVSSLISSIIKIKKFFFPTEHDKFIQKLYYERLIFYNQFIKQGDLCFDVGANVGDRTQIFLELNAKVVSIEPQESCANVLKKKFGKKISLLQKGVGSKNEIKDFFISKHNQLSTFSTEWIDTLKAERFKDNEWNESAKVEIITLDSVIEKYGIPQFIKIDVEGYELEALKGLTKPFKFLSFEFAVPDNFNNLILCLQHIQSTYKNLGFNYAVMDNTYLSLDQWITFEEMNKVINTQNFSENSAGDIYIKLY